MRTVKITLRNPLPKTANEMRARVQELVSFRQAIDSEIRDILGAMPPLIEECSCKRCGHVWIPKRNMVRITGPKSCPRCHSIYWNRERINANRKITAPAYETVQFDQSLAPPPVAPLSLRERLSAAALQKMAIPFQCAEVQQPAAETEAPIEPSAVASPDGSESDSVAGTASIPPEVQAELEELEQESLNDA